jgi:hypothetical protein
VKNSVASNCSRAARWQLLLRLFRLHALAVHDAHATEKLPLLDSSLHRFAHAHSLQQKRSQDQAGGNAVAYFCYCRFGHGAPGRACCGKSGRVAGTARRGVCFAGPTACEGMAVQSQSISMSWICAGYAFTSAGFCSGTMLACGLTIRSTNDASASNARRFSSRYWCLS